GPGVRQVHRPARTNPDSARACRGRPLHAGRSASRGGVAAPERPRGHLLGRGLPRLHRGLPRRVRGLQAFVRRHERRLVQRSRRRAHRAANDPGAMSAGLRIVVSGLIAQYPLGGVAWDYLQYIVGLARLGHDVYYLEDTGQWPYNPVEGGLSSSCTFNVEYLNVLMARYGLAD